MGQRSGTETVIALVTAFLQRRTWSQASLARHVGVGVPALRKKLLELSAGGMPFEREEDHPHVYWSVPRDWLPGAIAFTREEVPDLLRALARVPQGSRRDGLIAKIVAASSRVDLPRLDAVVSPSASPEEEMFLPIVQESAGSRCVLHFKYFSSSRGVIDWRSASIHKVLVATPARFLAVCHRTDTLKWFRLECVVAARIDVAEAFRARDAARIDEVLRESIDGFHDRAAPLQCAFVVRAPECRWVERNLPGPMESTPTADGIRFRCGTSAVIPLARFVVGLGGAAWAETEVLANAVRELALGALGEQLSSGA